MKNLYHRDIYEFESPVKSYWESTTSEKFNIEKLKKQEHLLYLMQIKPWQ